MTTTVATELNNICQERKLEIEYTYKRALNEFKMDIWTATVEIGKRVWVGNGCSSRKKARNSAAGEAYPDVKRLHREDEKRGGDNLRKMRSVVEITVRKMRSVVARTVGTGRSVVARTVSTGRSVVARTVGRGS